MECVIAGESVNQEFALAASGNHAGQLVWKRGEGCVGPEPLKLASVERKKIGTCSSHVKSVGDEKVYSNDNVAPKHFSLISYGSKQACAGPVSTEGGGSTLE